ncbi:peroxide stress protein YaaA [Solirubrobacter sp. CPCC 204708]|uniref:Peroxide stress protein YaaA n=1 Tax=Solirubrobacter deserti TaxID=2282478 RepID=A0ABT4REC9_9ACTN|nr:peroxide stress protein YaaA [Solirubrobacter deserti]MBE2316134.1 peroxide stress protein YaaA [Solirubrobacter deserti]MDA0136883.1 peroxide stress protein YaaA [Solirubrobacter deserti]
MLILLPPSEGKTAPSGGEPVDVAALPFPGLNKTRERLLDVLSRLTFPRALTYLDIGPGLEEEARRNLTLRDEPAAPAHEVYTGVLYEHLGLGSFADTENVLIASALWGFVRPGDRIPAYRLSMGATLPHIASLPALWRDPLRKALPDEGLIVDLRSGAYIAAWKPKQATVVGVRAFVDGKTVSHMVKATRGDVARILLQADPAETPEDVAGAVRAAGHTVELSGSGRSWTVDVIT